MRSIGREAWFDMILMPKRPNPSSTGPVQDGFRRFGTIKWTHAGASNLWESVFIWFLNAGTTRIRPEQAPSRPSWTGPFQYGFVCFCTIYITICRCVQLVGKHDLILFWCRTDQLRPEQVPFTKDLVVSVQCTPIHADTFDLSGSVIWYDFNAEPTNSVLNRPRSRRNLFFRYDVHQYMQMRPICGEAWFDMISMPKQPNLSWTGPIQDGFGRFGAINTYRSFQLVGERDSIWF